MKMKDMYVQPGYLVRRLHQIATAAFMLEAKQSELTAVQFAALLAIRDNPGIDATRISDLISFDRTTIGHVLARLEERGLITRQPGIEDKRTKTILITLQGEAAIRDVQTVVSRIADRILAHCHA